jgi:putative membrane protein insertion efficiency factor
MTNFNTSYSEPSAMASSSADASLVARLLAAGVAKYQFVTAGRVSPCRFYPSCSAYAHEALLSHGAVRGSWLSLRRLSRCRPLGPHGVDLVPLSRKAHHS